ncbi:3861_t:CDS:2 [Funneliformis geosporum]|uniref:16828_t:CDS:1 n=1 Tax=Funneliformis geosporum TaxID=1117311 RepID=A0A9W4WZI9_9GLOM|nr:3861_t:CDS:2 [Funneliformis geosporum]CAI2175246.1 16828_t:CDS:2 [Funneliformis geosporum]
MLLMQVPKEIHLLIIESILESSDSVNDFIPLLFTCRHFANLCLYEIWKIRRIIEYRSLKNFYKTLTNNPLMPYGNFILRLQMDELDNDSSICIDAELLKFFSERCNNLQELILKFSQKKRKNKTHLLPLKFLGDRLNYLSIVNYEHLDDVKAEQMERSSLINCGHQILKQVYHHYNKTIISSRKIAYKLRGRSNRDSIDYNETDEAEYHDALSEIIKLGAVKCVRLYDPKMTERVWESFTSSATNSLQAIKIKLNSPKFTTDPSTIVSLFGQYCKNLRLFIVDTFQVSISKKSMMFLMENCKKLEYLDISASSETVPFLHTSKSIISIYLSHAINGKDLNQINERMENLKRLTFLKIEGNNNLRFLKNYPNLEYLSIVDFREMNEEGFFNISKLNLTELELIKTPNISDEVLLRLGSMRSLIKLNIKDRLSNVTQKGWINLVKRPVGCPSWRIITIDDGRQINPEFFKILEYKHLNLEFLKIRGFIYGNLLKDDTFEKSKFKEAWWYYKIHSSTPLVYWPIGYKKKNANNRMFMKEYYKITHNIYSIFKQEEDIY